MNWKQGKLLDIKTISTLLGFLVLTGSDSTSAFVCQGKLKSLKVLEKCPEILVTFGTLGNPTHVNDELLFGLERFVCAMFGKKSSDIPKSGMRSPNKSHTANCPVGMVLISPCCHHVYLHSRCKLSDT